MRCARALGLAAPTLGTSLRVNLADLDANPGNPLDPGVYLWGVRIVPLNGGAARQVISAGRQIVYQRAGGGQSTDGYISTSNGDTGATYSHTSAYRHD